MIELTPRKKTLFSLQQAYHTRVSVLDLFYLHLARPLHYREISLRPRRKGKEGLFIVLTYWQPFDIHSFTLRVCSPRCAAAHLSENVQEDPVDSLSDKCGHSRSDITFVLWKELRIKSWQIYTTTTTNIIKQIYSTCYIWFKGRKS